MPTTATATGLRAGPDTNGVGDGAEARAPRAGAADGAERVRPIVAAPGPHVSAAAAFPAANGVISPAWRWIGAARRGDVSRWGKLRLCSWGRKGKGACLPLSVEKESGGEREAGLGSGGSHRG
jgi:hypothetical protein